ncbi:MAG: PTS mannitol transporter subunit IICBA [Candidatus Nanopelagicales bacterium]
MTTVGTQSTAGTRVHIQRFGTFLSNMVMPNMAAFIAWGLITALVIEAGWITLIGRNIFGYHGSYGLVEHLGAWGSGSEGTGIVGPMITYLLPLLIGYTGGRMTYDDKVRGGVVGAIATIGAVTGADVPMFLGAMIMGPLGGATMKWLDAKWEHKIRPGFEMLVNNFSAGIWGMILAIVGFAIAGPFVEAFSRVAGNAVDYLVSHNLLPLTSIFVEPAKVLFLNNAINHGVFTPLGTEEAVAKGKSILFLIEANPGPGLGLLLAFTVFGSGVAKASAPGAAVIQFLGGIHEVYFPFVLMKPKLILAVILGGMTGVATNMVFGSGLRAPAAPGSIIAVWIQAPPSSLLGVTLSVALAATVTFLVAGALLKLDKDDSGDLAAATESMQSMKGRKSLAADVLAGRTARTGSIKSIVFACDAGMGSSAMGASVLRRKITDAGITGVTVVNKAIANLADDVDLVVTHQDLTRRAELQSPSAIHMSVDNFMASPRYDEVVDLIRASEVGPAQPSKSAPGAALGGAANERSPLDVNSISLHGQAANRAGAIDEAGNLLVRVGAVRPEYVAAMHEREASISTFMGEGLALPHGTNEAKDSVLRTSVSFVRYDSPIDWGGEEVDFVVAIGATGHEHLGVISQLARVFSSPDRIEALRQAPTREAVVEILSSVD